MSRIQRLLELNGFVLHRQNKHLVYKHIKTGQGFTISRTASDWRVEQNQISNLKHFCYRNHLKYVDDNNDVKKQKSQERKDMDTTRRYVRPNEKPPFNAPKVIDERAAVTQEKEIKTKQLDAEGLALMIAGFEKGASQGDIANTLNALGYRTEEGCEFRQPKISAILVANGCRRFTPAGRKKKEKAYLPSPKKVDSQRFVNTALGAQAASPVTAPEPAHAAVASIPQSKPRSARRSPKKSSGEFLQELTDVLTSIIKDDLKERIVLTMFREYEDEK